MESEETAVESLTFRLQHPYIDLYAGLAQLRDATPLHLCELVDAAHHYPTHTFLYYKVGTRRRLPIVRTRLKRHVERGIFEQRLIGRTHRSKGIHLGMSLTATHVVAFADDTRSKR